MRVCLLNESFPPVIDGVVNVMMNYADYMRKDYGAEIAVGTPRYPDADYSKYPYKVVPYHSIDTAALASGYRAGNPFEEKAIAELAAFQPDIIHSHCPASATVMARILREESGAPIVFTYHTKYDIDIERWVKVKAVANEGIKAYVSNIEACDEVWTVSRGAGESLKALGFTGDYIVMNNGVDFARGRVDEKIVKEVTGGYDLPENIPVYLFVGRIITYKGLPLILDALKQVSDVGQDFRMVFVGKGPDREMLENKAKELGIGDKCIFVGPVYDREKLRAWNTRADLFLFPSTFDTNGLVVREAAACGLASVLIKDSCAAEGVTDGRNGFIVEQTADAMAKLLISVGENLEFLSQVGQHAMDEIYLSWQECVATAYERYQVVLDKKRSGLLPERKKMPSDYFLSFTAHSVEEQEKRRRIRQEIFHDFRETAVGMMENMQEAEENLQSSLEEREKQLQAMVQDAPKQFEMYVKEESKRIQTRMQEEKTEFQTKMIEGKEQFRNRAQEETGKLQNRAQEAAQAREKARERSEQARKAVTDELQETRNEIRAKVKEELQNLDDKMLKMAKEEDRAYWAALETSGTEGETENGTV